jgi:hypothetical protein
MAPFDVMSQAGTVTYALTFVLLGVGFGAALEMSGFGDTRKLAAQFYLTEMTVLKVMFTAIVVAAVLVFTASAFGLARLRPGVRQRDLPVAGHRRRPDHGAWASSSAASARHRRRRHLDPEGGRDVLLAGTGVGVWLFGETVGSFQPFFLSSDWAGTCSPSSSACRQA